MSSLNQAFIKAYGRESGASNEAAAQPAASTPQSPVLENWYAADTWYRAEAAAASVPPPHVSFPAAYQAPTVGDLSSLVTNNEDSSDDPEYRLTPEVVVEEEPVGAAPSVSATSPAVVEPVAAAPDLSQLYASVQVTTSWEEMLGVTPPLTTFTPAAVAPAPVVAAKPAAAPPEAKPAAKPEAAKTEAAKPEAKPAPQPASEAKVSAPTAKVEAPAAKPLPPVHTPRLDAAAAPPIPKPHVSFAPAAAPPAAPVTAPVAKTAPPPQPAPAPAPPAPSVAAPALGLLQPAWEVDRFQWPDHCRQLLSSENQYLTDVGVRLSNAARDGLNILAITSTRRGEGRTTLALCLARAAADAGVKVALVDADIENAQLVNELGVEASCGWQEVVLGKQPLSEAAIVSLEDKFAFFPWTSSATLKSLNDPRATKVLREIAKTYSLVILDLGPVPGRETRMFEDGENCPIDAAILVRDLRWTSAIEAQRVAAQLTAAGVESVGIAENFGPRSQQVA